MKPNRRNFQWETTMLTLPEKADVLAKLVAWGDAEPAIRAMILTSSLTRPDGPVDMLSDYDIILAVTEPERFAQEEDWKHAYGRPMVRWGDESTLLGLKTYFRSAVYDDYVKMDYGIWPVELLQRIAAEPALPEELDVGYRVLLDKDGHTSTWKPPTYQAHIPARPTEAEYLAVVEEGWWTATYVAKSLWRDELVFTKFCMDYDIKLGVLRRMLEWRIELDHNWGVKPGVWGRGLKQRLPADIWSELADTYVGLEPEANWDALFRTLALFRRVAKEVGNALGYTYPQHVDDQVSAYLHKVRQLPGTSDLYAPKASQDDESGRT
jgi:aminoglycoside 6-adenylyltransferase